MTDHPDGYRPPQNAPLFILLCLSLSSILPRSYRTFGICEYLCISQHTFHHFPSMKYYCSRNTPISILGMAFHPTMPHNRHRVCHWSYHQYSRPIAAPGCYILSETLISPWISTHSDLPTWNQQMVLYTLRLKLEFTSSELIASDACCIYTSSPRLAVHGHPQERRNWRRRPNDCLDTMTFK